VEQTLIIGTRGSQLALWQANWTMGRLEALNPGLKVEVVVITTTGDRVLDVSLPKLGAQGKGLFTKELEDALFAQRIDLAVHSLKDLPTELPPGLGLGAICEREDLRDALVARPGIASFSDLPRGAIVGTSSLRRQSQLIAARPDLVIQPVRGNVDTRLRRLDEARYDAIVLAAAGLHRLGHADRITEYLDERVMLPAPGQGALGIETRADDPKTAEAVRKLNHEPSRIACQTERAVLKGLGGGCLVPIGALARVDGDTVRVMGFVASPDGSRIVRAQGSGGIDDPEAIGQCLAEELLRRGAGELLAAV